MDLVKHLEGRLLFAVPKKGRLLEQTKILLEGAKFVYHRSARLDIALVTNHPIALVFLTAADIPVFVGEGKVDVGITGWDQVVEYEARNHTTIPVAKLNGSNEPGNDGAREVVALQTNGTNEQGKAKQNANQDRKGEAAWEQATMGERGNMAVVMDLGFGGCKLQVQVPENGEIQDPRQLVGKNVVTSFVGLTERYFAWLEAGQEDGGDGRELPLGEAHEGQEQGRRRLRTHVKYVGGSVEAACALGVADGIVDLVESGETMRAAGLHALTTLVTSTAVLISSTHPSNPALVSMIAKRLRGVLTAQRNVYVQYNISRDLLQQAEDIAPGKRAPTVTALEDKDWVAVSVVVAKKEEAEVLDRLEEVGAVDILVSDIKNSRAC